MKKIVLLIISVLFFASLGAQTPWKVAGKYKFIDSLKFTNNLKGNTSHYFITKDTVTGLLYMLPMDSIISSTSADTATVYASKIFVAGKYATLRDLTWELVAPGSGYIIPKNSKKVMINRIYSNNDSTQVAMFDSLYSTYIGYNSGYSNTTGSDNNFIGWYSGYNNTEGSGNQFYGYNSGYNNTTGEMNVFMGHESGYTNSTGLYNTFIGGKSGLTSTTGSNNLFIGYKSGTGITTESNRLGISSINFTFLPDTSNVIIWGIQDISSQFQHLWLNSTVYVKNSLLVNNDTVFVKNDTVPTNGLATKSSVAAKYVAKSDSIKIFMKSQGNYFTHYVGELYGGGIVISIWKDSGVEHGLIMTLTDLSAGTTWSSNTANSTGGTSLADGAANTTTNTTGDYPDLSKANYMCDTLATGGYTDWYLPSLAEMRRITNNMDIIFQILGANGLGNYNYWTSTEASATNAYIMGIHLNTISSTTKTGSWRVRALRKF